MWRMSSRATSLTRRSNTRKLKIESGVFSTLFLHSWVSDEPSLVMGIVLDTQEGGGQCVGRGEKKQPRISARLFKVAPNHNDI